MCGTQLQAFTAFISDSTNLVYIFDSAALKWILCFLRNFVQLKDNIAGAVRRAVKSIAHIVVGLKVHVPLDFIV